MLSIERWGLEWYSRNKVDGETRQVMFSNGTPLMFKTRRQAREYANERYGYIKTRQGLRRGPHGWRMPRAKRMTITMEMEPKGE